MKTEKIAIKVESKDYGHQKVIKIAIDDSTSQQLCILFLLLKEALVDTLELNFLNFSIFLNLQKKNSSYFSTVDLKKNIFKGTISLNSLEYILSFLLKYYRDGFAEAEHIDVDFANKGGEEVTLTIKCDSYKEYSSDEVKKILGL